MMGLYSLRLTQIFFKSPNSFLNYFVLSIFTIARFLHKVNFVHDEPEVASVVSPSFITRFDQGMSQHSNDI